MNVQKSKEDDTQNGFNGRKGRWKSCNYAVSQKIKKYLK